MIEFMSFENFMRNNFDVIGRAFNYYEKSLEDLQENETPNGSIPLLKDKVEDSILEIKLIKKLSNATTSDMDFINKKMNFIYSILKYYEGELIEDLEDIEDSTDDNGKIKLLQEEIEKVNDILEKF